VVGSADPFHIDSTTSGQLTLIIPNYSSFCITCCGQYSDGWKERMKINLGWFTGIQKTSFTQQFIHERLHAGFSEHLLYSAMINPQPTQPVIKYLRINSLLASD
jgi:hypothetical protein